jgi:hypothetical protein
MTAAHDATVDARPSRRLRLTQPSIDADVGVHVFSVSAGLVGVCLTVIGIIRIGIHLNPDYSTVVDELLAADSVCFMASCLLAYASLRSPNHDRAKHLEGHADRLFLGGMAAMCVACSLIAFSLL